MKNVSVGIVPPLAAGTFSGLCLCCFVLLVVCVRVVLCHLLYRLYCSSVCFLAYSFHSSDKLTGKKLLGLEPQYSLLFTCVALCCLVLSGA